MSLPSLYGGEPEDEIAIWSKVIDPSHLPAVSGDDLSEREDASIAGNDYQTDQAIADEAGGVPSDIGCLWASLSDDQRELARRLIAELARA